MESLDIFNSVKSKLVEEITPEILETSLDLLLEDGLLKDIPILGLGFKGYSLYQNVSDAFFLKKILRFLSKINQIPLEQRQKFIQNLERENETSKAGEKLLVSLNRLDDIKKADIIGNLFKHTILGNISYSHFSRMIYMIDYTYIQDLISLKQIGSHVTLDSNFAEQLFRVGFLKQTFKTKEQKTLASSTPNIVTRPQYELNKYANDLIAFGFEKN